MTVIPLEQVWVEANFKEVQLRQMRIGQPVKLKADLYGSKVEYHGRVAGLGAGTGAAFALLPAQNATGNWIKVVQRVPVRIELDAEAARRASAARRPVDGGQRRRPDAGRRAAAAPPAASRPSATQVLDAPGEEADGSPRGIIAQPPPPGQGALVKGPAFPAAAEGSARVLARWRCRWPRS